jgi:hypothetical protein
MRRTVITWSAVMALLIAGFGASVVALNADIYSAHGFVGRYLNALERQDSAAALALPGVRTGNDAAAELLTSDAMGRLSDVRTVSDTAATLSSPSTRSPPPTVRAPAPNAASSSSRATAPASASSPVGASLPARSIRSRSPCCTTSASR